MGRQLITCTGCGAVNNVPDEKPGRPVCGRCGANLLVDESPKITRGRNSDTGKRLLGMLIAGIVVTGWLAYSGAFDSHQIPPSPKLPVVAPEQPTPRVVSRTTPPKLVFTHPTVPISTGLMIPPSLPGLAPLKVKASENASHYIKLSSLDGVDIASMFVKAGESFEVAVPLGTYELKSASGEIWYGLEYYFGPDTVYGKADELFVFRENEDKYLGHKVRLQDVVHGNFEMEKISASEF